MSSNFAEVLTKIKSQQDSLEVLDERAVELGVVIPLLRQLGWDTDDVREIYPQKLLYGAATWEGRGKVDYALQTGGKCLVLMEVKRWSTALNDKHEDQLAEYCRLQESGPILAVLTNGRHWKFFLPPLRSGNTFRYTAIRKFLDIDIFTHPAVVESSFNKFLARGNSVADTVSKTQEYARALIHKPSPTAFTFIEPGAKTTKSAHTWNEVIHGLCEIMAVRYPERCRERVLLLGYWFSTIQSKEFPVHLKALELYVKRVSDPEGQQAISDILGEFGYPARSFTISISR